MGPKKKGGAKANKKSESKRQTKIIEDKTFGLKNKNKSKKVQQFINRVTKQVQHQGKQRGFKTEEERAAERKAAKQRKQQEEKELRELFAASLDGGLVGAPKGPGRRKQSARRAADARAAEEEKKRQEEEAAKAIDPYAGMTLIERIEAMRADLSAKGIEGTPVNAETFAKWKADRAEAAKKAAEEKVTTELKKGSRGKGLSVLSGRELFEYNASLFRDDEAAAGAYEIPEDAPDSDEDEADEQAMATQDDDDGEAEEVKDGANGTEDAEAQAKTNAEMLNFFDVADGVAGLNLAQTPSPAEEGVAANGITEVDEELFAREEDDDLEDLDDDDDDEDDDEDEDEDGDEDVTGQSAAAEGAA
mmetsp:Transcript_3490/g.13816  ORF Transcript_3490/g.13816 Transcript_3490/m.13816 type:complete len:361 (-) Transcript_3490:121-1203(-)